MIKMDMPRLLDERGYKPLKVQEKAVASAALSSLTVLGESSVRALLYHMAALAAMQERELLSNYKEFEKALWSALGSGADIILKRFDEELAKNVQATDMGPNEVLDAMKRDQPYVFMRNISAGEHVLVLYRSTQFRDRMLGAFFDSTTAQGGGGRQAKGAILSEPASLAFAQSITWRDLQEKKKAGGTSLDEKVSEWTSTLGGGKLRLARDSTWLLENNIEETAAAKFKDAALVCACDLRVGIERAAKAMESHNYVVLEDSKIVYARD
ncbi:hypothetical protein NTE_02644 [Candidatus Nitrososphaera evergladensis SR1]|jgi:hypothetical protein|uniref:Uncharacterized protein n=1 Tax=Candidatus Nitrososphaera evergladensis SR1 TaxID=1459636 RepID=A0A075MVK0_9ARCH|nr:hypothetical protein [Candidatus Nitrososphaera evergladensis]AIF84687.1 hypothetical protein NTE_02644 [Candidatus Nitrososphaera evergladensis SR1]